MKGYTLQCCGNCKYHEHENIDDGYVCVNSDSAYCAEWTDCMSHCEEWEGKTNERRN